MVVVKFRGSNAPEYKTPGAAGMDLCSSETRILKANSWALVKTGLYLEIPEGYEIQVRSRSGLAVKDGIFVLNAPGTIDSDYRGEVGVVLANFSDEDFKITAGDRIAQLVLAKFCRAELERVEILSETDRGDGGFGSTGRV